MGANVRRRFVVTSPYLDRSLSYDCVECSACRHQWAVGNTDPDTMTRIYSGAFHDSAQQWAGATDAPVVVNARLRAQWLRERGLAGRLIDIGAGNGYFVKAAMDAGFAAEGLELSADAAARAASIGARVAHGDFLAAPVGEGAFDVVTMWDVLSGFVDPCAALARSARLLKPGGHLVATVVDSSAAIARLCGRYWPLMIPPVNLHFFSPGSLRRAMEANGLGAGEVLHQGKRVSLRFAVQKLLRSLRLNALEPSIAGLVPPSWSVTLNLGDIATVVARRP